MLSSSHILYDHLIGGADKNAVVFHKESEQIVATLKGHTKKVTSVVYHPKEVKCLGHTHMCACTYAHTHTFQRC